MTKATYQVSQKTRSAEQFDARPHLGTGGQILKNLRDDAPGHAAVIDAVWHAASHMNGVTNTMEKEMGGFIRYSDVNPPSPWGKATVHARDSMAKTIDPRRVIASRLQ